MFNGPSMLKTKGQVSKANVFKNSGGENSWDNRGKLHKTIMTKLGLPGRI